MLPIDFYFLTDKDLKGVFLVTRDYWKANRCIPLEHKPEWEHMIPEGFVRGKEDNFYRYQEKKKICYKKGIDFLLDKGFKEIHWGQIDNV